MRTKHLTSLSEALEATADVLAAEYHSITNGQAHEFSTEEARGAYASAVYAIAMFRHPLSFTDELLALNVETFIPLRVLPICRTCKGSDVTADAFADWDSARGEYALRATFDENTCQDCGYSGSNIFDWVAVEPKRDTRVRIKEGSNGDRKVAGRTGSVVRPNHAKGGLYIALDPLHHGTVEEIALVDLADLEIAA